MVMMSTPIRKTIKGMRRQTRLVGWKTQGKYKETLGKRGRHKGKGEIQTKGKGEQVRKEGEGYSLDYLGEA